MGASAGIELAARLEGVGLVAIAQHGDDRLGQQRHVVEDVGEMQVAAPLEVTKGDHALGPP